MPGKQRFELARGAVRFADMRSPGALGGSPRPADVAAREMRQTFLCALNGALDHGLTALASGLLVSIDVDLALAPDIAVLRRSALADDSSLIDPSLVVEILTPASAARSATERPAAYLARSGVRAVALVDPAAGSVAVFDAGAPCHAPELRTSGPLALPGLVRPLDLDRMFRNADF